jgi:hypothetical protein
LLVIIPRNPKLGAYVQTSKNSQSFWGASDDATMVFDTDTDISMVIDTAQNMKCLSEASLSSNPTVPHIIANIPSYPQLTKLQICGLKPEEHIWSIDPTSLTSLSWQLPEVWRGDGGLGAWVSAAFLVNVVETTCPKLESLDISCKDMSGVRSRLIPLPTVSIERFEQYRKVQPAGARNLERLRHFEFRYYYGSGGEQVAVQAEFVGFVRRYGDSEFCYHPHRQMGCLDSRNLGFNLEGLWFTCTPKELDFGE